MTFLGVSIDISSPKSANAKISSSGIKICDHFVLTHCSIVWNLIKEYVSENINQVYREKNFNVLENGITQYIKDSNFKFSTVLTPTQPENLNENINSYIDQKNLSAVQVEAFLEHAFISVPLLYDFLHLLFNQEMWKFEKSSNSETGKKKNYENIYLSTFMVLKIKEGGSLISCLEKFRTMTLQPKKGATVFIDGCPFGVGGARSVFLNSLSKGIISNTSQAGDIFLTDARCILGCEGAPVYSLGQKVGVCGIVLSPFCWLKGEWIGLTFVAALDPLLKSIVESLKNLKKIKLYPLLKLEHNRREEGDQHGTKLCPSLHAMVSQQENRIQEAHHILDVVNVMERCIVRIMCSNSFDWGTGVVIDKSQRLVVTCAHVTRGARNKTVVVIFEDGTRDLGFVLYETVPWSRGEVRPSGEDPDVWDLAVVRLRHPPPFSLPLAKEMPLVGTPVLIGGHPLFEENVLPTPTFSLGNLAKVCTVPRSSFGEALALGSRCLEHVTTRSGKSVPKGSRLRRDFVCPEWRRCEDAIPVLVQTTCAVYSGVSGGPIVAVHPSAGPVIIGVIASCARDVEKNVCFPHVNMATPSFLLSEAVDQFIQTKDRRAFSLLKIKSLAGLSLWSLEDSFSSKL